MAETKIEIQIGNISFCGEGEPNWLEAQLDKILDRVENLADLSLPEGPTKKSNHTPADFSNDDEISKKTLVTFLKDKNATTVQVEKFLATAAWLEARGQDRLTTTDVSSALKNASQTRLGNPSDALAQNISKGFCEKDGKQFFVTQEGKEHLRLN